MKAVRIIQLIMALCALTYLVLSGLLPTPRTLNLPGVKGLPTVMLVVGGVVLGFLLGWVPSRLRRWQLRQEISRLELRVAELERTLGIPSGEYPIIPDRDPQLSRRIRYKM